MQKLDGHTPFMVAFNRGYLEIEKLLHPVSHTEGCQRS